MLNVFVEVVGLARQTAVVIDQIAKRDPDAAKQCRRALMSVGLNIAEGEHQRGGLFRARMVTAMGSANEVKACLVMSEALGYIDAQPVLVDGFDKVARTLTKLMR